MNLHNTYGVCIENHVLMNFTAQEMVWPKLSGRESRKYSKLQPYARWEWEKLRTFHLDILEWVHHGRWDNEWKSSDSHRDLLRPGAVQKIMDERVQEATWKMKKINKYQMLNFSAVFFQSKLVKLSIVDRHWRLPFRSCRSPCEVSMQAKMNKIHSTDSTDHLNLETSEAHSHPIRNYSKRMKFGGFTRVKRCDVKFETDERNYSARPSGEVHYNISFGVWDPQCTWSGKFQWLVFHQKKIFKL